MIEKDDRLRDEGIKENLTSTPILGRSEKFLNRRTINNERNGLTKRYSLENTNFKRLGVFVLRRGCSCTRELWK